MDQLMNSQEARKFLPAFADGELDVEQNLRVLEQMAMDPTNTKRVLHQQQLRRACARVMGGETIKCPEALRQQIARSFAEPSVDLGNESTDQDLRLVGTDAASASAEPPASDSPVLARLGRWTAPLAAAAVLTVAGLVGADLYRTHLGSGYTGDGLVTASLAQRFSQRHERCSINQALPQDTELFPAELAQLDEAIAQQINQDAFNGAQLDLSSIGYDYHVAGFCPAPGKDAIHVIYKNAEGRSLSLWVKAYDGQPTLDPGVPYTPPQDHADRPMMVWREANMVFYLVGDVMDDVKKAHPAIRLASRV